MAQVLEGSRDNNDSKGKQFHTEATEPTAKA